VGLLLKTMRPMWWRWVRILRGYKRTGRLLDVGCGEGYFLQYAEKYYDTYGSDVSEYCIREAKQRTDRTRLSVGSVTHIDYEDENFDMITCFDVLEHLDNPGAVIRECRRVLKRGGVFVARVPNTLSPGCKWKKEDWFGYKDKTHVSLLSNEEWFEVFRKNDFEIVGVLLRWLVGYPLSEIHSEICTGLFYKNTFIRAFSGWYEIFTEMGREPVHNCL